MNAVCEHKTGKTVIQVHDFQITKCTYGCGRYIFEATRDKLTFTIAELDADELARFVAVVDLQVWSDV